MADFGSTQATWRAVWGRTWASHWHSTRRYALHRRSFQEESNRGSGLVCSSTIVYLVQYYCIGSRRIIAPIYRILINPILYIRNLSIPCTCKLVIIIVLVRYVRRNPRIELALPYRGIVIGIVVNLNRSSLRNGHPSLGASFHSYLGMILVCFSLCRRCALMGSGVGWVRTAVRY